MKDLKTVLAAYAVPPPAPAAVQSTAACLQTAAAARRPHLSDAEFLRRQLGFISPRMWVLQVLFAVLVGALALSPAGQVRSLEGLHPVLGAAPPLLVLINITDWVRVYNGGMLELELATRYSLPRVAAARMLIFGLSDAALLLALSAFTAAATRTGLLALLVRVLAPFNAMCAGCLWLLRKARPQQLAPGAVLLAVVLAVAVALADSLPRAQQVAPWAAALALATLALAWQGCAYAKQERGVHLANTVL